MKVLSLCILFLFGVACGQVTKSLCSTGSCDFTSLKQAFDYLSTNNEDVTINVVTLESFYINETLGLQDQYNRTVRFNGFNEDINFLVTHLTCLPSASDGLMTVTNTNNFIFNGFLVSNCNTNNTGALSFINGSHTISNCIFFNNTSNYKAAAIQAIASQNFLIKNVYFAFNNVVNQNGTTGVVTFVGSNFTIDNCTFTQNGLMNATTCVTSYHFRTYRGFPFGPQTGHIKNTIFAGNIGMYGGGLAIFADPDSDGQNLTIYLNDSQFISNAATYGAGVLIQDIDTYANNLTFINNYSYGAAGMVYSSTSMNTTSLAKLRFSNSAFSNNTSLYGAGGLTIAQKSTIKSPQSRVLDHVNFGGNHGGDTLALSLINTTVDLLFCVFADNNDAHKTIDMQDSDVTMYRVIVTGNYIGVSCTNSNVTASEVSIFENNNNFMCSSCIWSGLAADPCIGVCANYDPCTVCNGNGSCVGCDGIPYSNATCTTSTGSTSSTSSTIVTTTTSTSSSPSTSTTSEQSQNEAGSNNKKKNVGAIVGGVVGGAVGLSLLIAVVIFFIMRRKRDNDSVSLTERAEKPGRANSIELAGKEYKPITNIDIGERLGGGAFADVYRGTWNKSTTVALKMLKDQSKLNEFASEAAMLLSASRHTNIVQFFGIHVKDGTKYIVTEFMSKGNLRDLLVSEPDNLAVQDLIYISRDIASALVFLSDENIIHADIAARNILIAYSKDPNAKYLAKLGDLGLSKVIHSQRDYYQSKGTAFPVKWSAPEVIEYGKYSVQSDVWSFGVTLFEIFSYGKLPYSTVNNEDILTKLESGYRLPQPEKCPQEVYKMMLRMWDMKAKDRPSFGEVFEVFDSLCSKHSIPLNVAKSTSGNESVQYYNN